MNVLSETSECSTGIFLEDCVRCLDDYILRRGAVIVSLERMGSLISKGDVLKM